MRDTGKIFICLLFAVLICPDILSQFPGVPSVPQPYSFPNNNHFDRVSPSPQSNIPRPGMNIQNNSIHEQNARIMLEVQQHQQLMNQQMIQENINESVPRQSVNIEVCKSVIPLPDFSSDPETEYFHNAFEEINKMLTGEASISIKDAVFLAENAYFGNTMSYTLYNSEIKQAADLCREKIWQQGLNPNDNFIKNMMAFNYITDTLEIKLPGMESVLINYPMKYDFEDFYGRQDMSKQFVTKLIAEHSGQCSSMPKFHLILAEELGTEAYLSRSPEHSFIKIKDNSGNWYNLELTSGAVMNDQFYIGSGYIKAEALRNRIYLEPLTQQQTIAQIMTEMAGYYVRKYGYDSFVKRCLDTALKYDSNNLSALMQQANYHTARALYVIERTGLTSAERLPECPQAYSMYQLMNQSYKTLDDIGHEEMPPEAYAKWLNQVNIEKEKPENKNNMLRFKQIIK